MPYSYEKSETFGSPEQASLIELMNQKQPAEIEQELQAQKQPTNPTPTSAFGDFTYPKTRVTDSSIEISRGGTFKEQSEDLAKESEESKGEA